MSLLSTFTSASINGWRGLSSQGYLPETILFPTPPVIDQSKFGYGTAMSGDGSRCAVKTYYAVSGTNRFNIYIFKNNFDGTWSQEAQPINNETLSSDYQMSMNYAGDVLVSIGLSSGNKILTRSGSTWSVTQTISSTPYSMVSCDVSPDGDTIIFGQPSWTNGGRVLIYTRSGGSSWSNTDTLNPTTGQNTNFGRAVSISSDGNYIISTAPGFGGTPSVTPSVYVFEKVSGSWTQQARITSFANLVANGWQVAVDSTGTRLAFTCITTVAGQQNRIYVFVRSGSSWTQEAFLTGDDAGFSDNFGNSLEISNDGSTIITTATTATVGGTTNAGKLYIFNRINSSWYKSSILTTTPTIQQYGMSGNGAPDWSASISDDASYISLGEPGMNTLGTMTGLVAIFTNS